MSKGLDYVYPNPNVFGEECPVCGKKSWDIFKCNDCGKVFCKHCAPELVLIDEETNDRDVTCTCGNTTLFV